LKIFIKDKDWQQKPVIFGIIALLMVLIAGIFASQIQFEEDISKLVPVNKEIKKFNSIYKNSTFFERLIFNVSLEDSTLPPDPDKLISFVNDFVDSLNKSKNRSGIKEITYRISDEIINDLYNYYYENLPFFLEKQDYAGIDSLISQERINPILENDYKLLVSPASMVLKKFILRDPLSLIPKILNRFQRLQFSGNFELYNGYILTKDKKNLLFFVSPRYHSNQSSENNILLKHIDKVMNQTLSNHKLVRAEYFGSIAVSVENSRIIKSDVLITVTISTILLILFISLFFRVKWAFLLTFLPALFGAVVSLAILYLIKTKISAIALGVGSILLGLGVDYALYMLSYFKGRKSISKIRELIAPIILCSITTAAVFFCLIFVNTEALHDLGLFITFSVLGAAFFSIIFLPHFINVKNDDSGETGSVNSKLIIWFSNYRFDKNIYLLVLIIAATIVFVFTSQNVEFESDMRKMSYVSEKLREAENNLNKISDISQRNVYVISSGVDLQDVLETNEAVLNKLKIFKKEHVIKNFSSISPILPSNSLQQKRLKMWNKFWQSGRKDSLITYIHKGGKKLNFTLNAFDDFISRLNKQYGIIHIDKYPAIKSQFINNLITVDGKTINLVTIVKAGSRLNDNFHKSFSSFSNVIVADIQHLTTKMVEMLKDDFKMLIDTSSIIVLFILLVVYGRIELGIIVFLPIVISWVWILGIMSLVGEKFTIFNIIISTLILGTGVDYTILITRNTLQDYRYSKKDLPSYKTGIFFSASTTIIGVGVLFFAHHPALKSIALLPIVGYCSVVLITFILEVPIERWLLLSKKEKGTYPITIVTMFFTFITYSYFILGCFLVSLIGFTFKLYPLSDRKKKYLFHFLLSNFVKSLIYLAVNLKKEIINPNSEKLKKPAVIICNHQSVLDILFILSIHPKLIMMTNNWVWNSVFFGKVVQFADFYPVTQGIENSISLLKGKVEEGYSIVVFPEGTRSVAGKIKRFHKGAFFIAEKLSLDVLPVLIHGTADCIRKGEFSLRSGKITLKYLDRIPIDDKSFGDNYSDRTKSICNYFREQYKGLKKKQETPNYYKDRLIKNYIYKGPILEWYLRIKLKLENNYIYINDLIPHKARIADIGCGYGYVSYLLGFISEERQIVGIDYDENKIITAQNCFSKKENIHFEFADISQYNLTENDVFLLVDILHYLPFEQQRKVLVNCINNLAEGGSIIIKDADNSLYKKHIFTKLLEFFSTSLGFNKVGYKKLLFNDNKFFYKIADEFNMKIELIRDSKFSSNRVLVFSK